MAHPEQCAHCAECDGLNRLGGSSLLDCVVFGRISGASAAKCLLDRRMRGGGGGADGAVTLVGDPAPVGLGHG